MAFIIGAVIGGVGAIAGGVMQGNAARDAAGQQANAANQAGALQKQMYDQTRADQEPWRAAGGRALSQMENPNFQKDFSMDDYQQDPGYAFRLQEGEKAINSAAAARGMGNSGATLKALSRYGQDFASNEYGKAFDRFNNNQTNRFNRLSSLAGIGQTANAASANAGQNYANANSNNLMGAANASSAATMAGANATSGALSGIGNSLMQYNMMNKMFPSGGTSPKMGGQAGGSYTPYNVFA